MTCSGYSGSTGCFMNKQENSFWGLCISCDRIQNRLFLETVQRAIRENRMEFLFHNKEYSLKDPRFSDHFANKFQFLPTSNDARLSLLSLCYIKMPTLFKNLLKQFYTDPSFLTSANLLYRKHLPSRSVCGMLNMIQNKYQQRFHDMPSCPSCMSRYLLRTNETNITQHEIDHTVSIFRNRILSQHPTWFVNIFKLLQTIWEKDLENRISLLLLDPILNRENPLDHQIEFRDWMGAFLETPAVLEKALTGKISDTNKSYLELMTGKKVSMELIKNIQANRMKAWKLDFIEKSWHPERFMEWCLDYDELNDTKEKIVYKYY